MVIIFLLSIDEVSSYSKTLVLGITLEYEIEFFGISLI